MWELRLHDLQEVSEVCILSELHRLIELDQVAAGIAISTGPACIGARVNATPRASSRACSAARSVTSTIARTRRW